jgi:hypothetical protein
MPICKVVNDNIHPFKQDYKEMHISIPAKGSIEMDKDEAVQFLGTFFPPKMDGDNRPDPKYFKKLHIEDIKDGVEAVSEPEKFVCQKCKHVSDSSIALSQHIDEMHMDDLADEDFKEKKRQEVAKRGPGRPPKEQKHEGQKSA